MQLAKVSAHLLKWLNGHPERLIYQKLVGQIVRIVPGSEFFSRSKKDGTARSFVKVIPVGEGRGRQINIARQFLEELEPADARQGGVRRDRRQRQIVA